MRRLALLLAPVALLLAQGCATYRRAPQGPGFQQRVRIAPKTAFELSVRTPGSDSLRSCRATEVRGTFISTGGVDTLVLGEPLRIVAAEGAARCETPRGATVRVVPRPADVAVLRFDPITNLLVIGAAAAIFQFGLTHPNSKL